MIPDSEYKGYKKLAACIISAKIEDWDDTVDLLYNYKRVIKRIVKDNNMYELDENMKKLRSHLTYLDHLSGFFVGPQMIMFSETCGFPDGSVILVDREKKHKEILKWAVTEVKKYFGYIYTERELLQNVDCQN